MASLKKFNGTTWDNAKVRKLTTATDTITTLPADLYADGTNATVGLKGNMSQTGTPTPDNPIIPQGTGERTGNLYNINAKDVNNGYVNNMQLHQDGTMESYTVSEVTEYIELIPNASYRLSNIGSFNELSYCIYDSDKQYITGYMYSGQTVKAINMPPNGKYLRFSHFKSRTDTMLNIGSTVLPYEPYGYKIPISSANTTTPVYLGKVETMRKIKKLVLTGEENLDVNNSCFVLWFSSVSYPNPKQELIYCTHYEGRTPTYRDSLANGQCMITINQNQIAIKDLTYATVEDFKTYLQQQYANGTPVTVLYVLATEETAVVNEPLMKIGTYADEVSGITIPTITGADSFDVDVSLKPSELSLSYTGWHNAYVKEYVSDTTIANLESMSISQMENHTVQELQGGKWV